MTYTGLKAVSVNPEMINLHCDVDHLSFRCHLCNNRPSMLYMNKGQVTRVHRPVNMADFLDTRTKMADYMTTRTNMADFLLTMIQKMLTTVHKILPILLKDMNWTLQIFKDEYEYPTK